MAAAPVSLNGDRPHETAKHFDVLIVGAGLSGIGAACHLQAEVPRARPSPSSRRATPSAAPGTCSATRASAPTRTCSRSATRSGPWAERQGDRRRRRRSAATSATPRATTASTGRSASTTASCAPSWSSDDARWTVEAERTRHRRDACGFTCGFLFACTGYYRYDEGYTPRLRGHRALRRADRPPAALARGPRLRRQARRRDRQRRDRGHARAGDGRAAPRT